MSEELLRKSLSEALEQLRKARAELEDARKALGPAWLYDGASLAVGIRRKTASLEELGDDETGDGA